MKIGLLGAGRIGRHSWRQYRGAPARELGGGGRRGRGSGATLGDGRQCRNRHGRFDH